MLGEHASHADVVALDHELHLDQPLYVQFGAYFVQVMHGNLGTSIVDRLPVVQDLLDYFPATVELTVAAMLVAILVGVPAGVIAAVNHRKWPDTLLSTFSLVGISVPVFWLGWMLLYLFAFEPTKAGLNLFPTGGRLSLRYDIIPHTHLLLVDTLLAGNLPAFGDALQHLVLPAITLGTIPMAIIAKMTRSGMLEVLGADYIRTARAKGVSAWAVIVRHGLRNALIPIVTVIGLQT